jgi:ABC-type nitrate/sulfonate/bicarbonate transport system permease component
MATFLNRALPFAFLGVVLVAWEAAARSGRWSKLLFPSLENIFRELGLFFTKTEMMSDCTNSGSLLNVTSGCFVVPFTCT